MLVWEEIDTVCKLPIILLYLLYEKMVEKT